MLTGDARCQKDECAKVMVKRELAAEKRAHRETKDELENLRATVRLQIEGGVRKWDAEHGVDLRSDLETKTRETRESRDRRNTAEKKARELAEDLADLYGIKADLLRQLSDLKTMSEKKDIAHRYELRALGREMREAQVTAVAETLWGRRRRSWRRRRNAGMRRRRRWRLWRRRWRWRLRSRGGWRTPPRRRHSSCLPT